MAAAHHLQRPSTPMPHPVSGGNQASAFVAPGDVTDADTRIKLQMLISEARRYHDARLESSRRPVTPARPAAELCASFSSSGGGSPIDWACPTPPLDGCSSTHTTPEHRGAPAPPPAGAVSSSDDEDTLLASTLPQPLPPATTRTASHPRNRAGSIDDNNIADTIGSPTEVRSGPGFFGGNDNTADDGGDEDDDDDEDDTYDGWADLQGQIEELWHAPGDEPLQARYQRIKTYLTWLFIWDTRRDWDEFAEVSAAASLEWITRRQVARLNEIPLGQLFIPA